VLLRCRDRLAGYVIDRLRIGNAGSNHHPGRNNMVMCFELHIDLSELSVGIDGDSERARLPTEG
jgi:hypothetical protein